MHAIAIASLGLLMDSVSAAVLKPRIEQPPADENAIFDSLLEQNNQTSQVDGRKDEFHFNTPDGTDIEVQIDTQTYVRLYSPFKTNSDLLSHYQDLFNTVYPAPSDTASIKPDSSANFLLGRLQLWLSLDEESRTTPPLPPWTAKTIMATIDSIKAWFTTDAQGKPKNEDLLSIAFSREPPKKFVLLVWKGRRKGREMTLGPYTFAGTEYPDNGIDDGPRGSFTSCIESAIVWVKSQKSGEPVSDVAKAFDCPVSRGGMDGNYATLRIYGAKMAFANPGKLSWDDLRDALERYRDATSGVKSNRPESLYLISKDGQDPGVAMEIVSGRMVYETSSVSGSSGHPGNATVSAAPLGISKPLIQWAVDLGSSGSGASTLHSQAMGETVEIS